MMLNGPSSLPNRMWAQYRLLSLLLMIVAGSAQGALIDRGNGLIYDDVLDITWYQIADLAAGSSFDDGGGTFGDPALDGLLTYDSAISWVSSLSVAGFNDWILPTMDVNEDNFVVDCRFVSELACRDNQLGHLYYYGLSGFGNQTGDQGPFSNILFRYWGSNEEFGNPSRAWTFDFVGGIQGPVNKDGDLFLNPAGAWAVRSGDVIAIAVPEPGSLALICIGLAGMGLARRREV